MDGIIANLASICDLAEKYDATVLVGDSHAVGFLGAHGRGTPEYCGVEGRVDLVTGTLGKVLGGSNGYTSGKADVVVWLTQRSRPYLCRLTALGFDLVPGVHPIIPVMIGDAQRTSDLAAAMLERGIYVIGFSFPVVPKGQAWARVQMSAAHAVEDVDRCVATFGEAGRDLGIIGRAATHLLTGRSALGQHSSHSQGISRQIIRISVVDRRIFEKWNAYRNNRQIFPWLS